MNPFNIAGGAIGAVNSLAGMIQGIKQVQEGKALQRKLDAQGRPIMETPEAFNETEGLVRSKYLNPNMVGYDKMKDSINNNTANSIQNIQQTAGSGMDALLAYNIANAQAQDKLNNLDMQSASQKQNDYNQLINTLGQKANYQQQQWNNNVLTPFLEASNKAKAMIQAGNQNAHSSVDNIAGYVMGMDKAVNSGKGNILELLQQIANKSK